MHQPAERDRGAFLVLEIFLPLVGIVLLGLWIAPEHARGNGKGRQGQRTGDDCQDQARCSGKRPKKKAGMRRSASPITPPSPVGSGQAAVRGRQEAKAAAKIAATSHKSKRQRSR